jgi:hypothetical protein
MAMEGPTENYAYVLLLSPDFSKLVGLAIVDVAPGSKTPSALAGLSHARVLLPKPKAVFSAAAWLTKPATR